jgi:hypothetical protein
MSVNERMVDHVTHYIIPAALSLLPARMDSPSARAMLLAIGLQESRFTHRVQVKGPAHGFWQFELRGGVTGVLQHPQTEDIVRTVLHAQGYPAIPEECYAAIIDNDTVACVFARLLLWTLPGRLPVSTEHELAWDQYLAAWRPVKPHHHTWNPFYTEAWRRVLEPQELKP